jgi:hypothetical protein
MHCKLIFWLTDQQEVNQCYTFTLSSCVLQHCRRRQTTFQRNRLPPSFGFQVSLKLTMNMEAVSFSERLHHNVIMQNTTITTYNESEKLKACDVKRKDSRLPDVMPCWWVSRSWHFLRKRSAQVQEVFFLDSPNLRADGTTDIPRLTQSLYSRTSSTSLNERSTIYVNTKEHS